EALVVGDDLQLPVLGADGAGPGVRPVHEHAVEQRHPAEADLVVAVALLVLGHGQRLAWARRLAPHPVRHRFGTVRSQTRAQFRVTLAAGRRTPGPAPAGLELARGSAAYGPRNVAEALHAELEIVHVRALVRRMDQPRRDLRVHRPRREEPVRDG